MHDNALEFLDNILRPAIRRLLVPLLDSQLSVSDRVVLANNLLGTDAESREGLVRTLLSSDDAWLRRCGAFAVGVLQMAQLLPALDGVADDPDATVREAAQQARSRLRAAQAAVAGR